MSNATFLGMPPFPEAAVDALADDQLRRNLHNATHTIRDKRAGVIGELDDWEGLRTRAASLKDRALHGLDEHLVQLEEQLTARGVTVHWARTADEACQIVGDIAAGHGVDEVVKVKSMATRRSSSTRPSSGEASPPGRPTSPNSSSSSGTTCRATSSCPRSTATAPRSATSSPARWARSDGPPPTT